MDVRHNLRELGEAADQDVNAFLGMQSRERQKCSRLNSMCLSKSARTNPGVWLSIFARHAEPNSTALSVEKVKKTRAAFSLIS
jgi:hypothetical protein